MCEAHAMNPGNAEPGAVEYKRYLAIAKTVEAYDLIEGAEGGDE